MHNVAIAKVYNFVTWPPFTASHISYCVMQLWYSSRPSLQKMHVTHHVLRNFEDKSRVGHVRHKENTTCKRLLLS